MTVEQVIPCAAQVDLGRTLAQLTAVQVPMRPFSEEVIQFCADFSSRLFRDRDSLRYPELQALAFWMRKAEITRLAQDFAGLKNKGAVLVPRGLVFHIPPANVDTIFVYSWLVSVLTGNRNIIRLSPRASEQTAIICRLFNDALASAPEHLRRNTVMLRYGHEREITAAISAAVDVRVLWGGDASVTAIRSIPVPPRAKELTFPDRYSFAVIRASAYRNADAATRDRLAGDFFNDVFWFDQMACSSPRLLVWVGESDETATASSDLLERVRVRAVAKGYEVQPQIRLNRFAFACSAVIDGNVVQYRDLEQLVVLNIEHLDHFSREHSGGGLLYETRIAELSELSSFVIRRDQTMTYFGLDSAELEDLTPRLQGIDRMIPIGQALNFNRFWDGYDLFQELTRHVSTG
jgi:hypothetical protein